jgi:hypothetical protein
MFGFMGRIGASNDSIRCTLHLLSVIVVQHSIQNPTTDDFASGCIEGRERMDDAVAK